MKNTISLVLVLALGLAAGVANADFTFGEPTNLGPTVNGATRDQQPCLSADGLRLFFHSDDRPGGYGEGDLWMTTRPTTKDPWAEPVNLGPIVNSSAGDASPSISVDGLELFFQSKRAGGSGDSDLWVTTRPTTDESWGEPLNLGPVVNSSAKEVSPGISGDGLSIYFHSSRAGNIGPRDIWMSTRQTKDEAWGPPVNLGPTVNSSAYDYSPSISADGRLLLIWSNRPGGYGGSDIWVAMRKTLDDPWQEPVNLGPIVNSSSADGGPALSPDGSILYFHSDRPGGSGDRDLWQVSIEPVVDLNGDGIVDSTDMCIIVDHWGTNDPLCDIGPTPLGDSIVDVQDLIVLAEHLFKDVNDPTLVAHWALDETEGDIAYDGANGNNGSVHGDPSWQPEGGMVAGALQFDGIDDYVSTPFVLNPSDGAFSVFAWVKGGAPGQSVLSQIGGVSLLCADSLEGNLMTELKGSGRGAAALLSQTIITDGNWHRIGLVWDGSHRTLYVDDVAVAEDEQTNLEGSENGLYIGTGKAMEPGSFWSGLIDDVRIYNRAVSP